MPLRCSACSKVIHELTEEGDVSEEVGTPHDDGLQAGSGEGNIEFAVDEGAVIIGEGGGGEEIELVAAGYAKAVNDDVALAALITLYCVDAHLSQGLNIVSLQCLTDERYLMAIGDDDSNSFLRIEVVGSKVVNALKKVGHERCLSLQRVVLASRSHCREWKEQHAPRL